MKSADLKLEYWAIKRPKPHPKNARSHPPEQVRQLVASIKEFGFTKPIVCDEKNEILAGHGAYQAALQLGLEKVPVVVRTGLSQAQKRAYRIADNKLGEKSVWEDALLAGEFEALKEAGYDLSLTGWGQKEVEDLLKPPPSPRAEPPIPALQRPVSVVGDLWEMGEHRLICGDSTKPATLKALMNNREAACVFTDPPYGVSYDARNDIGSIQFDVLKNDDKRRGELKAMLQKAFSAAMPHVRQDAGWYIWHGDKTRIDFEAAMSDAGLVERGLIVWAKPSLLLGGSDYQSAHEPCFYASKQGVAPAFHGDRKNATIWRATARKANGDAVTAIGSGITLITKDGDEIHIAPAPKNGRKVRHVYSDEPQFLQVTGTAAEDLWEVGRDQDKGLHPTMKPVELARRAIANSTREGEIVLDMFSGAGSTIIGAEQLGRSGYAVELDPKYVDATVRRWETLTGKEAIHAKEKKTFAAVAKSRAGRKAKGAS